MAEQEVRVLKDESLGGVYREFVEVERKGKIGDKIIITGDYNEHCGKFGKVVDRFEHSVSVKIDEGDIRFYCISDNEYLVLEPTDIVYVEGKRYKISEGKPSVNDYVLITKLDNKRVIKVLKVLNITNDSERIYVDQEVNGKNYLEVPFPHKEDFIILKPIQQELTTEDMIANLSQSFAKLDRKISELNEEINGLRNDLFRLDTELENTKHKMTKIEIDADLFVRLVEKIINE